MAAVDLNTQWHKRRRAKEIQIGRLMDLGLKRSEAIAQINFEQSRAVARAVASGARLQDIGHILGMTREAVRQWSLKASARSRSPLCDACDEGVALNHFRLGILPSNG